MKRCVPLEPTAEEVCKQSSIPPLIFQLPPDQGRMVLEKAQDPPVYKYPANICETKVETTWGRIPIYFVAPKIFAPIRNVIFYIHGAGWVFGSFHTHEKLVREIAARTNSLVIFPEYTRSPEAKYPVAIEHCYFVLSHIWEIINGQYTLTSCKLNTSSINPHTLTVAGDSVGGNMAIAMYFMSEKLS